MNKISSKTTFRLTGRVYTKVAFGKDPIEGDDELIFADDEVGIKDSGDSEDGEANIDGGDTDGSRSMLFVSIRIELCTFSASSISSSEIFGEQLPP